MKSRHRTRPQPEAAPGVGHNGFVPKHVPRIECVPIDSVKATRRKLKKTNAKLVAKYASNIRATDLILPIVVDGGCNLIHGHEIYEAALELGAAEIPVIVIGHLSEAEIRRYRIWLAKGPELSSWDDEALKLDFEFIFESREDLDLSLSGFELAEVDALSASETHLDADDEVPAVNLDGVTSRRGDLWLFGDRHRILCGDARVDEDYKRLMQGEKARIAVADPPYGVAISGHVSGLGKTKHREFVMGSAEMSRAELETFLRESFEAMKRHSLPGAVHAIWMDWRGLAQILAAGATVYHQTLNMCVWDKQRGAMGSLYRSQHELCFIFKTTKDSHVNAVQLGRNGRYRTNLWSHPGLSQFGSGRDEALKVHPTVKPVGLIYDIILDVSERNDIVLDPFLGSGTMIIAATRAGRRGYGMELDPVYVDVAISRIEARTGLKAVLAETGESFEQVKARRADEAAVPTEAENG